MNKISGISVIVSLFLIVFLAGCKKETILQGTDVSKIFPKKWVLQYHEIEQYSSGTLTSKKLENFSSSNFYLDFHSDGTYAFNDLNGNTTGKWHLLSDNNYVIDPGTVNERYYFILSLSDMNLIVRGPFTNVNTPKTNILFTAYYKNP